MKKGTRLRDLTQGMALALVVAAGLEGALRLAYRALHRAGPQSAVGDGGSGYVYSPTLGWRLRPHVRSPGFGAFRGATGAFDFHPSPEKAPSRARHG